MERREAGSVAIATPEIEDVLDGLDRLVDELQPLIADGTIGAVLGDDTSGRIPARMLHAVINDAYDAQGRPRVPLVFLQGTGDPRHDEAQARAFDKIRPALESRRPGTRVLVVTEGLTSGAAIATMGSRLTDLGIAFDVAALDGRGFDRTTRRGMAPPDELKTLADALELAWEMPPLPDGRDAIFRTTQYGTFQPRDFDAIVRKWRSGRLTRDAVAALPRVQGQEWATNGSVLSYAAALSGVIHGFPQDVIERLVAALRTSDFEKNAFYSAARILWDAAKFPHDIVRKLGVDDLLSRAQPRRADVQNGVPLDPAGWPERTRLFRGRTNAHPVRDRPDLTGLVTDKFPSSLLSKGTDEERRAMRSVRRDIRAFVAWTRLRDGRSSPLLSLARSLAGAGALLRADLARGSYGMIVGHSKAMRLPTLILGRAVNAMLRSQGKPPLPVIFLEGSKAPHHPGQIAEMARYAPSFRRAAPGSRALILSGDASGKTTASVIERLHDMGHGSDVLYVGSEVWTGIARLASSGGWRQGTKVVMVRSSDRDLAKLAEGAGVQETPGAPFRIAADRTQVAPRAVAAARSDLDDAARVVVRSMET